MQAGSIPRWSRRDGPYDDPSTLEQLRGRNLRLQVEVWRLEQRRLTSVVQSILKSSPDAEALVADVFHDFFHHYVDQLHDSRAIPSYLKIMAVRRARRHRERLLQQVALEPSVATEDPTEEIHSRMDDRLWLLRLEMCLAHLSGRTRGILKLHFGHEQSYSAISQQLGVSKQAVGKTVQKSLDALRNCLEKPPPQRRQVEEAR